MAEPDCTTKTHTSYSTIGSFVDKFGKKLLNNQISPTAQFLVRRLRDEISHEILGDNTTQELADISRQHQDKINHMLKSAGFKDLEYRITAVSGTYEITECAQDKKVKQAIPSVEISPSTDYKNTKPGKPSGLQLRQ